MLTICPARLQHVAGLVSTGRSAFADAFGHLFPGDKLSGYLDRTYGYTKIAQSLSKRNNRYLVARDGNEVVGFIKAKLNCPHSALSERGHQLQKLYVLPHSQAKGIGGMLLDAMLSEVPHPSWWLQVYAGNKRAQRFYERYGFGFVCTEVRPIEGVPIEFSVMSLRSAHG